MLNHGFTTPTAPARVVVIGAGGFIGGTIVRQLAVAGTPTLALTRRELDLTAADATTRLAGLLRPDDSVVMISAVAPAKTPALLRLNVDLCAPVCEVLAERTVAHLLYISSDAVYGDDANPVTEGSARAPSTLHGLMHAAREGMLAAAARAPVAFLRPTLVYGAADPHNGYGPNRFRREAQAGGPIRMFGEGEEKRDHILVDDVAALALLILGHRSRGVLNAVTGRSVPFREIAELVARGYPGVQVESQPRPGPRPHLLHRFFDVTACRQAFPRFRATPLEEGLERARKEG
jgi:nucleoside-diphosphate-sugar epimerase